MALDFQARLVHGDAQMVDYTPGSDVAAGTVVVQNSVPMIAHRDIEANKKGALAARGGVYEVACNAAIAAGKPVWWDDTNNRVTETATSNAHFGHSIAASTDSNTVVRVLHAPQALVGAIV